MYFDKNMTITEIRYKLKLKYNQVLDAIKRGDIYKTRHISNVKNNKDVLEIISNEVSNYYNLKDGLIHKKTSIREIIIPRQIAHTISYNLTKSSNAFIGAEIGRVDHATVSHSRSVICDLLSYNNTTKEDYLKIEELCKVKVDEYESNRKVS